MDYAIYSKCIDGIQTIKSARSGEVIGVLVYDLEGNLKQYFEDWGMFLLSHFGVN